VQPYLFPRQLRFCRLLGRGSSSPARFTVWPATFGRWIGTWYVLLTRTFKRITHTGSMMCFPFRKGYCGKPAHHMGVSNPDGFWLANC